MSRAAGSAAGLFAAAGNVVDAVAVAVVAALARESLDMVSLTLWS